MGVGRSIAAAGVVGFNQFADDPLKGIGAGNYDRTYFLERRTTEDIRQAHSIELQTLGELGLVGGLLLALAQPRTICRFVASLSPLAAPLPSG